MSDNHVFKVEKGTKVPFVQINKNLFINNTSLSCTAKCLLAHMLSRPDDWEFHITEVMTHFREGRDVIRNAFRELTDNGYLIKQIRREGGKFDGMFYTLYQEPSQENQGVSPQPEKPAAVLPAPVDRPLIIKKEKTNNERERDNARAPEKTLDQQRTDEFEAFWQAWPGGKTGRLEALSAWDMGKPPLGVVLSALQVLQETRSMLTGAGIEPPYLKSPANWIKGQCWHDEISIKKTQERIASANKLENKNIYSSGVMTQPQAYKPADIPDISNVSDKDVALENIANLRKKLSV